MKYDVVSIGSATIDNFADTDSEYIKIEGRHSNEEFIAYPLGTKVLIDHLDVTVGGGGTNTAAAFSSLGLNTAYMGKVGSDENGQLVIRKLKELGVDFIGAQGGQTGFSVILNSIKDDRTILTFKGSNSSLLYQEIEPFDTDWIYITSMLGDSYSTVEKIVHTTDAKVVFNPSAYQASQGYKNLGGMLSGVDILIVNLEEACKLLGRSSRTKCMMTNLFDSLSQLDPSIFVITDGSNGVSVFDKKSNKVITGMPMPGVKVIETTGAGDAFNGGFATALAEGQDPVSAAQFGCAVAGISVTRAGTAPSMPSRDEVDALLAAKSVV